MRFSTCLVAIVTAVLVTACGGGGGGGIGSPAPGPSTPALTGVTPPSGLLPGGTELTLTGRGFLAGVAGVEVGGRPAIDVNVVSDTEVTCTSPAGAGLGTVSVQVTTGPGIAVLPASFTYTDPALAPTPGLFDGPYFLAALEHSTLGSTGRTVQGLWTSDGTGGFAAAWDVNRDGTISVANSDPNNSYTALANSTLSAQAPHLVGASYEGGITIDGAVALLAQTLPGTAPDIACAIRRSGSFSNGTLNGTFHYAGFMRDGAGPASAWGTIEFTGSGAVNTGSVMRNANGAVTALPTVTGTYSLGAQGALSVSTSILGNALSGGVLEDGALLHATGGTIEASDLEAMFAIPFPLTTLGNGTFGGDYWVAGLRQDVALGHTIAIRGTATTDGAGSVSLTLTQNDEGIISTGVIWAGTYSVSANGTMSLNAGDRAGAVSQDGRFAWISGETSGGSDPLVLWLVRK